MLEDFMPPEEQVSSTTGVELPPSSLNGDSGGSSPTQQDTGVTRAQKMVQDIVFAVVIVLFLGFLGAVISLVTIWVQSFNDKSASYQSLNNEIIDQRNDIKNLREDIMDLKKLYERDQQAVVTKPAQVKPPGLTKE